MPKIKPPRKSKNIDKRPREHLAPTEIEKLMHAAKSIGRHKIRDATMILMAYRHGLRVSELVSLKWSQIDLKQGLIYINRHIKMVFQPIPLYIHQN